MEKYTYLWFYRLGPAFTMIGRLAARNLSFASVAGGGPV
jgi:hypothetical protein